MCVCVVDSLENYGFDNGTTTTKEIHIWSGREGGKWGEGVSH